MAENVEIGVLDADELQCFPADQIAPNKSPTNPIKVFSQQLSGRDRPSHSPGDFGPSKSDSDQLTLLT